MADVNVEVKQKKRKISGVFKKKNKENREEIEEKVEVLAVKETGNSEAKSVENPEVRQDDHERKKTKFGHRRFLSSSKKKKSKKQPVKSEDQSSQVDKEERFVTDKDVAGQLEAEKEKEFVEEKDKESAEKDNRLEFTSQVQNVPFECESPEADIQSDSQKATVQTMAINVNENNQQLENDDFLGNESQNTEDGSLIRALLRQGTVPSEETLADEHLECTSGSSEHSQDEQKQESNEVGGIIPNMFIANLFDVMIPGSMSNDTGNTLNTKSDTVYQFVVQTVDQTFSSLVTLINAFLTTAGRIPKEALVKFLLYLIKNYPHCFKIKKVKRKAVLSEDQVPADTIR